MMIDCVKDTRKPQHFTSRKWLLLLKEWNKVRAKIDLQEKLMTNEQMIREHVIRKCHTNGLKTLLKMDMTQESVCKKRKKC